MIKKSIEDKNCRFTIRYLDVSEDIALVNRTLNNFRINTNFIADTFKNTISHFL